MVHCVQSLGVLGFIIGCYL